MKFALLFVLLLFSCSKEMGDQPKIESFEGNPAPPPAGAVSQEAAQNLPEWAAKPTLEDLKRGQERYVIYCSVCHGLTGDGDGMVVQRGFPKPLPFISPAEMQLTREQIVGAIERGAGKMPEMSERLNALDRRKVAEYVKALQLSRAFPVEKLNANDRARLER